MKESELKYRKILQEQFGKQRITKKEYKKEIKFINKLKKNKQTK